MTSDAAPSGADWERVLSATAFVPRIVPDAILPVPADPSADERLHIADDKTIEHLKRRFSIVLADLERIAGWKASGNGRIQRTYTNFQGVETEIFDQARAERLETTVERGSWGEIAVPTLAEMLRIKAWLIISRNATRDYRDTATLADRLGRDAAVKALSKLDDLYPQSNGASALQQIARQLAEPRPFFHVVDGSDSASRIVQPRWNEWAFIEERCRALAVDLVLSLNRDEPGKMS